VAAKSFHLPSEEVSRGNVAEALNTAQHVLEGGIHIGGQEHFYLETQACLVLPKGEDGEMEVFSSTQHPTSIQVIGLYQWLNMVRAGPKTTYWHGVGSTLGCGEKHRFWGRPYPSIRPSVRCPCTTISRDAYFLCTFNFHTLT